MHHMHHESMTTGLAYDHTHSTLEFIDVSQYSRAMFIDRLIPAVFSIGLGSTISCVSPVDVLLKSCDLVRVFSPLCMSTTASHDGSRKCLERPRLNLAVLELGLFDMPD